MYPKKILFRVSMLATSYTQLTGTSELKPHVACDRVENTYCSFGSNLICSIWVKPRANKSNSIPNIFFIWVAGWPDHLLTFPLHEPAPLCCGLILKCLVKLNNKKKRWWVYLHICIWFCFKIRTMCSPQMSIKTWHRSKIRCTVFTCVCFFARMNASMLL